MEGNWLEWRRKWKERKKERRKERKKVDRSKREKQTFKGRKLIRIKKKNKKKERKKKERKKKERKLILEREKNKHLKEGN